MHKSLSLLAVLTALLTCACAGVLPASSKPPVKPASPVIYTFGIVACGEQVAQTEPCSHPLANAVISVNSLDGYVTKTADDAGYALFTSTIPISDLRVRATDYVDAVLGFEPPLVNYKNISISLEPNHVDPSRFSLEELAAIRGDMWMLGPIAGLPNGLPLGPRPFAADNVAATVFITDYAPEVQEAIINEIKSRGYTHVVMGPLVDSDGYHGVWQPNDWRGANFEKFLDAIQKFYDHGLKVVVFISPDGWTLEQNMAEFTPLLQQERAQKLLRIVIPHGWEPARYGTSSCTWALYGQWIQNVLPNALRGIHTEADVDGPVGTDDRCNDDDHVWNPGGNAAGWGRVAPFFHFWASQSGAFEIPDQTGGDREHPELTNFQNWYRQFDVNVRGSYRDRFEHGYAGWPRDSAWGPGIPIRVGCAEYSSYWKFWQHRTEEEAVKWGDACMAAGSYFYLDSGSVPVAIKH